MSHETIVFPDAVTVCVTHLADALNDLGEDAHVGSRRSGASREVVLTLVDAEVKQIVRQISTLRIDVWVDETFGQTEAQDLGQLCRGILGAMAGTVQMGSTVYQVLDGAAGLSDDPDPISGTARYSFHLIVVLRGSALILS